MLSLVSRLIPLVLLYFAQPFRLPPNRGWPSIRLPASAVTATRSPSAAFAASVHGKNACTSCHVEITDLAKHMRGEIKVHKVHCERCHKKETSRTLHQRACPEGRQVRRLPYRYPYPHDTGKRTSAIVVAKCIQCHDKEAIYRNSVHGKAVAAGNQDSAACNDCHNLHAIKPLGDPKSHENREFHTKVCMKCHADEKMMKRNNVFTVAVKSYLDSYHGKNYRLGFPEKVAGCADCHTAHCSPARQAIPTQPSTRTIWSRPAPQCHTKATPLFAKFYAHGEHNDREKYPILF